MFREAKNFTRAKLEQNCELHPRGQITIELEKLNFRAEFSCNKGLY